MPTYLYVCYVERQTYEEGIFHRKMICSWSIFINLTGCECWRGHQ